MPDNTFRHGAFHCAGMKTAFRLESLQRLTVRPCLGELGMTGGGLSHPVQNHKLWIMGFGANRWPRCVMRLSGVSPDAAIVRLPNPDATMQDGLAVSQTAKSRGTKPLPLRNHSPRTRGKTGKSEVRKESPGKTGRATLPSGKRVCALYVPANMEAPALLEPVQKNRLIPST
jgi:hypothetical protein